MVISMIAVMAILRDAFRLGFFEPLARWKLYRDLRRKREKAVKANGHAKSVNGVANGNGHANGHSNGHSNGHANGHTNGHASTPTSSNPTRKEIRLLERSVMRFAEQGWNVIYYPLQWVFGMVRFSILVPYPRFS
jgi:acyl-CoA-dependent ceramide synthase